MKIKLTMDFKRPYWRYDEFFSFAQEKTIKGNV